MDFYQQTYETALDENIVSEEKWRNFKKDLQQTKENLSEFVKQRNVNVMVPLGKKAFIRGTLQHTNEVTVSHGASYFSDVSSSQAIDIIEHRIKNCDEHLLAFKKEHELLSNKLNLPEEAFGKPDIRDIIEEEHEEEVKAWRRKHADSVKRMKQQEAEDRKKSEVVDVNKLLDEHEMMEELAEELDNLEIDNDDKLSKILSGELKIPESKQRIAHNIGGSLNSEVVQVLKKVPPDEKTNGHAEFKETDEINNNDLITQNNQEIVDLLKTYRCKIKDVLKNVKKDDERSLNLFLDLIELKDDIEDDIRKMNDEEQYSESDEKDSDDETTASIEVKPEETKRKVRFSTSLEDVKLIESKEQYKEAQAETSTIQIHFQHSDAKFISQKSPDDDSVIAHPGEVYKMFQKTTLTPIITTKSILKNRSGDLNSPTIPSAPMEVKPVKKIFHSEVQVIGDVIEHKKEMNLNGDVIHIASKDEAPKKVSKFRQMRLKS